MTAPRPDPEQLLGNAGWLDDLARRLVGRSAAADLVQDTWVAALRRPPRAEAPLGPWLATVLRRLARDRARGGEARVLRERDAARAEAEPGSDELVARAEMHGLVLRAVLELAEPYRAVILLRYFERLAPAEIARRRGVPASTVRSQLERGLTRLRGRLDERFGGERGAWCALVAGALDPSGLLSKGPWIGAMAMKMKLVGAGALGAVLVGFAIWGLVGRVGGGAVEPEPQVVIAPERARPEQARADEPTGAEARRALEAEGLAATHASEPSAPASSAAPAAASATRVRARLIDERREPVRDALLALAEPPASARADALGRVELVVHDVAAARPTAVEASAPGRATRRVELRLDPGATKELGDIELGPGGAIEGSIERPDGSPAAGARVQATHPSRDAGPMSASRRYGPHTGPEDRATSPNELGRFVLEGVPVGPMRVWAKDEGLGWAASEVLEVTEGGVAGPVRLRLASARSDVVAGRVVDPGGAPVPRARILTVIEKGGAVRSGALRADEFGRFELELTELAPVDLRASDPEGRYGEAALQDVEPGTTELVLQLREARHVELVVREPDGTPVTRYSVTAWAPRGEDGGALDWLFSLSEEDRAGGVLELRVPDSRFQLGVKAPGHAIGGLGPFEPDALPLRLELELVPTAPVRGRVLQDGRPVSGARVELLQEPSSYSLLVDGFWSAVNPDASASDITDEHGAFALDLAESGRYLLRAHIDGFAGAELGPMELDAAAGASGLELVLVRGGAIEGRVLAPPGEEAAGKIVAFNHGDGAPFSVRADADGRYRVGGLLPGRWQVRDARNELDPVRRSLGIVGPEHEVDWDCEVVDGETTRFDLDLRGGGDARLEGRVELAGVELEAWNARLVPRDASRPLEHERDAATAELDHEGRFALEAPAGSFELVLAGPCGAGGTLELREGLELEAGMREWECELETGSIRGRIDLALLPLGVEGRFTELARAVLRAQLRLAPAADGRFGPLTLPAGELGFSSASGEPIAGADVTISPGAALDISLP